MQLPPRQQRLRFEGLHYQTFPDGSSRIECHLDWLGNSYVGHAAGTGTLEGDLRASADATLEAVGAATGGAIRLTLIGIKAVRAFDGRVIIAAVDVRGADQRQNVMGAQALRGGDVSEAAALTVLDAINRLVAPLRWSRFFGQVVKVDSRAEEEAPRWPGRDGGSRRSSRHG